VTEVNAWLLIPGWGCDAGAFAAVLRCRPGLASRTLPWEMYLEGGRPALEATCAELGDGPLGILGWSLGALLALEAALAWPDRFAEVVLVGGTARFCSDGEGFPGTEARVLRAMRARLRRDREAVLTDFAAASAAPDGGETTQATWRAQARGFATEMLARGLDALGAIDLRERAAGLDRPVRLVHGESDAIVPWQGAAATASILPRARLEVLPGRGHALPLAAPAEVAARLEGSDW